MDQIEMSQKISFGNAVEPNLPLASLKVIYAFLNKINSTNSKKHTVVFANGELEEIVGFPISSQLEVLDRFFPLLGFFVEIEISGIKKYCGKMLVFDDVASELDDEGKPQLSLTCTKIFLDNANYKVVQNLLIYQLRSIINLEANYSQILFLYLERNRHRKEWEVTVNELRQCLGCHKVESYDEFKIFNNRVLKRCQKEILEKTECRFSYEPVKDGRKVVAIKVILEDRNGLWGMKQSSKFNLL